MVKIRKSPGVYVEEVSNLAPSVASVATAIPAFVGYTEKGPANVPVAITSYLEYKAAFGEGPELELVKDSQTKKVALGNVGYVMANAIRMYFDNGGGKCYIVSIGGYGKDPSAVDYGAGLEVVRGVDEVTLLACPDAGMLLADDLTQLGNVHVAMLKQAGETMDRFAILDAIGKDYKLEKFKSGISGASDYISYGAAYYPNLKHSYQTEFSEETVAAYILNANKALRTAQDKCDLKKLSAKLEDPDKTCLASICTELTNLKNVLTDEEKTVFNDFYTKLNGTTGLILTADQNGILTSICGKLEKATVLTDAEKNSLKKICDKLKKGNGLTEDETNSFTSICGKLEEGTILTEDEINGLTLVCDKLKNGTILTEDEKDNIQSICDKLKNALNETEVKTLTLICEELSLAGDEKEAKVCYENLVSGDSAKVKIAKNNALYKSAVAELQDMASKITPSGAVVGAIVKTDSRVGVWKAPANIGLASVADVTTVVTTSKQDELNIDADTGYSVNCIRKFFGKGFLIWGARTLDGLDNEWRYIPVRRLFNYIEESVQKSTMWAVFEPNDTNTWVKIKCQISNFLTTLWSQGALVGATPDDAYFVNVGVPTTMTTNDVLEGRLIVEVGIAASRPAEFITLVFSHKMEQ